MCLLAFGSHIQESRASDGVETPSRNAARTLANEAANAYAQGEYLRAHELCVRAYRLVPAPTIALLDARSLVQMQRLVDAVEAYDRAVHAQLPPDAPDAFQRAVREASVELPAVHARVARVKVVLHGSEVSGRKLSVRIGERRIPSASFGQWVLLDPGRHVVHTALGDVEGERQRLELREGETRLLPIEVADPARRDPLRPWGYVGLGVGTAGLALGVIAGTIANEAHDRAVRDCPNRECVVGTEGADAVDRFRKYRAISTVGYGVGAAAAVFGAVILFRPRSSERSVTVGLSLTGIRVAGSL